MEVDAILDVDVIFSVPCTRTALKLEYVMDFFDDLFSRNLITHDDADMFAHRTRLPVCLHNSLNEKRYKMWYIVYVHYLCVRQLSAKLCDLSTFKRAWDKWFLKVFPEDYIAKRSILYVGDVGIVHVSAEELRLIK